MKKIFNRADAYRSLRPTVASVGELGEPTDEQLQAEITRLNGLSASERKDKIISLGGDPVLLDIQEKVDALDKYGVCGTFLLNSAQTLLRNVQNVLLFANAAAGSENVLQNLDLSYSKGVFTNISEQASTIFVSYQLCFASSASVNGFREAFIRQGTNYDVARVQMSATPNVPTYISGSTVLRLAVNDTFTIRASHTNSTNTIALSASPDTKLVIANL